MWEKGVTGARVFSALLGAQPVSKWEGWWACVSCAHGTRLEYGWFVSSYANTSGPLGVLWLLKLYSILLSAISRPSRFAAAAAVVAAAASPLPPPFLPSVVTLCP